MIEGNPSGARGRDELKSLLRMHAVLRGDFVLSSGVHSSYYLDARLVTLSGVGNLAVGRVFLDAIRYNLPDGVAGLTLGADPIITAITLTSALSGIALDGFIVRKERKEHGAARRIEGPWRPGLRLVVVDDTLTTGNSSLEAARAVEDAGASVTGVFALIDREQGAREAIEAAGYPFTAIFTAKELTD